MTKPIRCHTKPFIAAVHPGPRGSEEELMAHLRRTRGMRRSRHHTQKTSIHGRITDADPQRRARGTPVSRRENRQRRVRVDSDSSLASNAAVGRSTLRAGGCHLLDDWRASSFRVNRPSAPETLTGRLRQLLSFAGPNSNVGSQSEAVVASGISTDSSLVCDVREVPSLRYLRRYWRWLLFAARGGCPRHSHGGTGFASFHSPTRFALALSSSSRYTSRSCGVLHTHGQSVGWVKRSRRS